MNYLFSGKLLLLLLVVQAILGRPKVEVDTEVAVGSQEVITTENTLVVENRNVDIPSVEDINKTVNEMNTQNPLQPLDTTNPEDETKEEDKKNKKLIITNKGTKEDKPDVKRLGFYKSANIKVLPPAPMNNPGLGAEQDWKPYQERGQQLRLVDYNGVNDPEGQNHKEQGREGHNHGDYRGYEVRNNIGQKGNFRQSPIAQGISGGYMNNKQYVNYYQTNQHGNTQSPFHNHAQTKSSLQHQSHPDNNIQNQYNQFHQQGYTQGNFRQQFPYVQGGIGLQFQAPYEQIQPSKHDQFYMQKVKQSSFGQQLPIIQSGINPLTPTLNGQNQPIPHNKFLLQVATQGAFQQQPYVQSGIGPNYYTLNEQSQPFQHDQFNLQEGTNMGFVQQQPFVRSENGQVQPLNGQNQFHLQTSTQGAFGQQQPYVQSGVGTHAQTLNRLSQPFQNRQFHLQEATNTNGAFGQQQHFVQSEMGQAQILNEQNSFANLGQFGLSYNPDGYHGSRGQFNGKVQKINLDEHQQNYGREQQSYLTEEVATQDI